jgi:hypothetical protein
MAYKTSVADATALANQWYALMGRAPDDKGLSHWIGEIQKDGSNTAWQNFSGSPESKAAGVVQKAAAQGINPVAPPAGSSFAGQAQLPGTNKKSWDNTFGATVPPAVADALRMAAEAGGTIVGIPPEVTGAIVNNIGHGAINNFGDVLKRGAMGAVQGGGVGGEMDAFSAAQNAGQGVLSTLGSTAKGALKGAIGGQSNLAKSAAGALGIGSMGAAGLPGTDWTSKVIAGSPVLGDGGGFDPAAALAGMSPDQVGAVGNTSNGGHWYDPLVDAGKKLLGGGGTPGANPLDGLGGLLNVGAMANATAMRDKQNNFAKLAGESVDRSYNQRAGLRAAGIAGMGGGNAANNYTPTGIPAVSLPQLGALAKQGNPFANAG